MTTSEQPTVVSASGKVLVAGGYLVLDRKYDGIVIGISARFYTVIFSGKNGKFSVYSPQFDDGQWDYQVNLKSLGGEEGFSCELESTNPERRNSFVEIAINYSLSIISRRKDEQFKEIVAKGLEIYIVGDNDFYSQREQLRKKNLPLTSSSLKSLEPFCKVHCTLKKVNKTGLGSSAALITSLVSALFVHFGVVSNQTNDNDRKLIHNVAQFCHCLAQGKVGSGFDVSAAIWGSHIYKRFSPNILENVMNQNVDISILNNLIDPASSKWDNQVTKFSLPHGFKLVLADVDAGSNTPSMVGKVLKWHKDNIDRANTLWDTLASHNTIISNNLRRLNKNHEQDKELYINAIKICESVKASEWALLTEQNPNNNNVALFSATFTTFQRIRELLREMTELSQVPIEPPKQTKLLDACNEIPGTIMAGIPGAGGYDAIFCIGIGNSFSSQIEKLWNSWEEMSVGPLLSRESSKGYMIEQINNIPGLSKSLNV
ncbi:phosphomevalonate kinase [Glomus cerebriforme]|uniref:Phosphomevalonate kinase n=1 Tax=Glomus cerebriforme TaxID=658196 RepID=A0A397S8N1_9GLOM|nr:phosphomevalonate kinase [Glomus cerebriforme]